jgi:ketosteroid isomerase-like protein
MSSVSIHTLTNGYTALAARDDERLMECLAEDVELRTFTGSYLGHEGIRRWIADMDEGWSQWQVTIHELEEIGDRVLVEATLSGHSSVNDITMSERFWVVWEIRDGRAALGVHCADREEAVRVAESSERLTSPRI